MDINELTPILISETSKKSSNFIMKLDTDREELNHVFGLMKPTVEIPFISWNNITKIHRDFSYDKNENWINPSSDFILLKFKRWSYESPDEDDYGSSKILLNQAGIVILIQLFIGKKSHSIDVISNEISKSLNNMKLIDKVERDIFSEFTIPNQSFQKHILLDMITNDPLFTQYLSIPELLKTKKKTKTYLTVWFYPKRNKEDLSVVIKPFSFTITQLTDENKIPFIRIKPKKKQDLTAVNLLRDVISRLFSLYYQLEDDISKIYNDLGVKDTRIKAKTVVKKSGGKVKGQTRRCQDPPTSFETIEDAKQKLCKDGFICNDEMIMKFPKDNDVIDGYDKQLYYACIDKVKNHWAGLTRPDANIPNDIGVPCCFVSNQISNKNSSFTNYIKGQKTPMRSRTKHILGPDKILINKQQGVLHRDLNVMFAPFIEPLELLLRNGVNPTPKSFLFCVSTAANSDILESSLVEKSHLAKQEMYDYSINEIQNIIRSSTEHLDAKHFISLFEEVYQLNIYLLNKNGLVKPRYKHGYIKRQNKYRSIIIYEHDMTSSNIGYNRYELLSLVKGTKIISLTFDYESKMSVFLRTKFFELTAININDMSTPQFLTPEIPPEFKIQGQVFDESGKTRVLKLLNNSTNKIIHVQTEPLQPFDAPELLSDFKLDQVVIPGLMNVSQPFVFKDSTICSFVKTKRLARYLIDYVFWLFNKYNYDYNSDGINKFISEKIKIVPDYKYVNITQKFNETTGLMNSNKLILQDEQTKKRIEFILALTMTRNPSKIKSYSNIVYLPAYFSEISDFNKNMAKETCDPVNRNDFSYNIFSGDGFTLV